MGKAVRNTSNTAHKNRLTFPLSGFLLPCGLSKGESWTNWGSKLVLLIENQIILVRVLYPVLPGMKQELISNLLGHKSRTESHRSIIRSEE